MHNASPTIGAIAAALAKAQAELLNPEKSLVATLAYPSPDKGTRTFRYAPLSRGLEIVRASLGRHEIAVMQTTAIDDTAGLIRLVTVLAHASGEWISSDWPVCPISETASPHRLGAALTYARRYALFTLVGIAGEDDLDAPDLAGAETTTTPPEEETPHKPNGSARSNQPARPQKQRPPLQPALDAQGSAALRDEILRQLTVLSSADEAGSWAGRILKQKNRLTTEDARIVEQAFEAKIASLGPSLETEDRLVEIADANAPNQIEALDPQSRAVRPPLVKTVRRRDKKHLRFVATQPCLVCGRLPSEAHHLRFAEPRALGRKVSDEFTVPLCRGHHRELHNRGNERGWWEALKIDPAPIAQRLWSATR
jgi:hypothetical protein